MGSIDLINDFVDGVKVKLNAANTALGSFTRISERDEDPAQLSQSRDMPILIIIPLSVNRLYVTAARRGNTGR